MKTGIRLLPLVAICLSPGRFLFRREKKDVQARNAALDEVFSVIRHFVATAVTLKPEWVEAWDHREDVDLPPKYQADKYIYPGAVEAAYDAKFTRALLYQNRWNSQIKPLFDSVDADTWAQVRATIERLSMMVAALRERNLEFLRAEEASWMDRAVQGIDEARYHLRRAEQHETPVHEVIGASTFQALYSILTLSESMLDGLRREAADK